MHQSGPTVATAAITALLARRAAGATVCPSEVARSLAGPDGDWRALMPDIHAATDGLLARRRIAISWKGQPLARREGPYRIGAPA